MKRPAKQSLKPMPLDCRGSSGIFNGELPDISSCDVTQGCVDADCERCYPVLSQRDIELAEWRKTWGLG